MSQVQGGGSYKQRREIMRALIKMFIVWIDMYGVVVMLWMKQWKCRGHLIAAHWGSPVTGNESKGSKTIRALTALEASWAARLQVEKPLELAMMDLNWNLDFQETAPWLGADREISSFSYWYKIAEENCIMPAQSSPWSVVRESHQARVIREAAGERGEWGQVQRDGLGPRQWWLSVSSAVPLPEMCITPSNRSRIQGRNGRVKAGWNN